MPAIKAPATILVTGASGFIASWLVKELIDRGFNVRGTVRSDAKGEYLKNLFGDKFSYVIVKDLEHIGGFDEAVKGVQGIAHTASPVTESADDPDELIRPAVNGTLAVLKSAKEFGTEVKRIIVTSSVASLLQPKTLPAVYSEEDWNESSIEEVKAHGRNTPNMIKYRASKTLAEKAIWKFTEENKGSIGFDVATILPPFVFGPTIHRIPSASSINLTVEMVRSAILHPKTGDQLVNPGGNFIDVRDLVHFHAETFVQEAAGGQRWLVANRPWSYQWIYDLLNNAPTPLSLSVEIPKGQPGATKEEDFKLRLNTKKASEVLGFKARDSLETFVDTLKSLEERGFLVKE